MPRAGSPPRKRRWIPWLIAVVALFVGIGLGAAGSGGSTAELDAANEEIATLESDLAAAEDQNVSLEDSLAEAEAKLVAAGDAAATLDAREDELNAREDALDKRENRLADREANVGSKPDTAPPSGTSPGAKESEPGLTAGQENALRSAEDYLAYSAFSRSGLIEQLKFEGYSTKDSTFAVDTLNVDWNQQAAKAAEDYLAYSAFSRSGLVEQLMFDGYTRAQAEYGADKAGL